MKTSEINKKRMKKRKAKPKEKENRQEGKSEEAGTTKRNKKEILEKTGKMNKRKTKIEQQ